MRVFQPILEGDDGEDPEPDFKATEENKCWIAPCIHNRKCPPLKGWIPADPVARGNPTIKYILRGLVE